MQVIVGAAALKKSRFIHGEQSEQWEKPSETGEAHVLLNGDHAASKMVDNVITYVKQRQTANRQLPS